MQLANPFYVNGILVCGNSEFDIPPTEISRPFDGLLDFGKKIISNFKPAYIINDYNYITLTVKLSQLDPKFTQIKEPLFLQKIDDGSSIDLEKKYSIVSKPCSFLDETRLFKR